MRMLVALFAAMVAGAGFAKEYKAAVYPSWHNHRHQLENNHIFEKAGVAYTNVLYSKESMDEFHRHIDEYSFILVPSLYNYTKKPQEDPIPFDANSYAPVLLRWIENGGTMYIGDANYPQCLGWLKAMDERLEVGGGHCEYLGPAVGSEPMDPIVFFPKRAEYGFYWGHMGQPHPERSDWKVLARCGHGEPTLMVARRGKGIIVIATPRTGAEEFFANLRANQMFLEVGLTIRECNLKEPVPGDNRFRLSVENASAKDVAGTLTLELTGSDGTTQKFSSPCVARAKSVSDLSLACRIERRGAVRARILYSAAGREGVIFDREIRLADLFVISPARYRGMVSHSRRFGSVRFGTHFYPFDSADTNYTVEVKAFDGRKVQVAKATARPAVGEGAVALPLSRTLRPGAYAIRAALVDRATKAEKAVSETRLEIRAEEPNLTLFDEDLALLNDGEPYFPLGLYHPARGTKNMVDYCADFAVISDLGFNAVTTFGWAGMPPLEAAAKCGMKTLFEPLPHNTPHLARVKGLSLRGHPASLFYYTMDEPRADAFPRCRALTEAWHEVDANHPTVLVSCDPAHYRACCPLADALVIDTYPYDPSKGENSNLETIADYTIHAMEAADGRTPVIACLQAFGYEPEEMWVNMNWQAIIHGAKGVFWYAWNEGRKDLGLMWYPKSQAYVAKFIAELKPLLPAILNADAPMRGWRENGLHAMVATDPKSGTKYLVTVNPAKTPLDLSVKIPELKGAGELVEAYGDRKLAVGAEGSLRVTLPKFGSAVWCWGGPKPVAERLATSFAKPNLPARRSGKTRTVKAGGDLQKAIDQAKDGDLIKVGEGIYGPIVCDNRLVDIVAVGSREKTIIDAGGKDRCATLSLKNYGDMSAQTNTLLSGFTLRNGNPAKSAIRHLEGGAALGGTLVCCSFEKNVARYGGGAAWATLEDCALDGNTAFACGGGASHAVLTDCTLNGNKAQYDGGALEYCEAKRCRITRCHASRDGGAAHLGRLESCRFEKCDAARAGGATAQAETVSCLYLENSAGEGGGLYDGLASLASFVRNKATREGAAAGTSAPSPMGIASVSASVFSGNQSFRFKGSLQDEASTNVALRNCWTETAKTNAPPKGMRYFREKAFMNAGGDFRPRPNAPFLDTETTVFLPKDSEDLVGNPRRVGRAYDAGCCECVRTVKPHRIFDLKPGELDGKKAWATPCSLADAGATCGAFGRQRYEIDFQIDSSRTGTVFWTYLGARWKTPAGLRAFVDASKRLVFSATQPGTTGETRFESAAKVADGRRHTLAIELRSEGVFEDPVSVKLDGVALKRTALQEALADVAFAFPSGKVELGDRNGFRLTVHRFRLTVE